MLRPLVLAGLLLSGPTWGAMPQAQEVHAAAESSAEHARRQGLTLVWGTLWEVTLRLRTPLVAAHVNGRCHLGYSAYTPGTDYRWLFPALPEAERQLWLQGLIHHELAHCADQAQRPAATRLAAAALGQGQPPAPAPLMVRDREVLADLAFALHVAPPGPPADAAHVGAGLVRRLADLRAANAAADPAHDSSAELRCYLSQRTLARPDPAPWLARLQAWRDRCGTGAGAAAPDSPGSVPH